MWTMSSESTGSEAVHEREYYRAFLGSRLGDTTQEVGLHSGERRREGRQLVTRVVETHGNSATGPRISRFDSLRQV